MWLGFSAISLMTFLASLLFTVFHTHKDWNAFRDKPEPDNLFLTFSMHMLSICAHFICIKVVYDFYLDLTYYSKEPDSPVVPASEITPVETNPKEPAPEIDSAAAPETAA